MAADTALIAQLVERKVLSVLSGSALLECFVSEVLDSGRYKRHVDQVRARLHACAGTRAPRSNPPASRFEGGLGEGMFLWGRVPDSTPVDELVRRAREKSILLAQGSLFSPAQGCEPMAAVQRRHSFRARP